MNKQDFQKIFILPSSLASVKFKFLAKMVTRRAQDNLGILTTQASENNETFNKPVTTLVLSIITAAFIIFGTSVGLPTIFLLERTLLTWLRRRKQIRQCYQNIKNTTNGHQISIYDEFVTSMLTMGLMSMVRRSAAAGHDGAHLSSLLLPWHREFISRFEKALQTVNQM